jgi:hypothetical protein
MSSGWTVGASWHGWPWVILMGQLQGAEKRGKSRAGNPPRESPARLVAPLPRIPATAVQTFGVLSCQIAPSQAHLDCRQQMEANQKTR